GAAGQEAAVLRGAWEPGAFIAVIDGEQVHQPAVSLHLRNSLASSITVSHDPIANCSVLSGISANEDASAASAIWAQRKISSNGPSEALCGSGCCSVGADFGDSFFGSLSAGCSSPLAAPFPLSLSP